MSKFKVGDKVRVSNTTKRGSYGIGNHRFPFEGEIVQDADFSDSYGVKMAEADITWSIHEDMMELVEDEPKVQVGDKVRVTKVYEFVVGAVSSRDKSIWGSDLGHYANPTNPAHTIEVIERAKPKFQVGQVLTEVEEVEALPIGGRISMVDPESGSGNLWTRTDKGLRGITGREYSVESLGVVTQFDIRVVWLPENNEN